MNTTALSPDLADDVAAVMRAARVIAGIVAESLAEADGVTLPQLRTLVLVDTRPGTNASAVAQALNIHPSNATRMIDRLVQAGLLNRHDSTVDRRHLQLKLTGAGSRLVGGVMEHRRTAFRRILRQMAPADRRRLTRALQQFAAAAGEPEEDLIATV
jgi:DNA-binding MarR family transcriptional regulator